MRNCKTYVTLAKGPATIRNIPKYLAPKLSVVTMMTIPMILNTKVAIIC